ncbi:hypothetical protein PR202_gb03112 [Eleusine coracana subsp. coracana]|uniref:TCP domain-containing protein n=1 Tax=Eleusine coracana subsp. coracana TaxID=191504 RepID=A0AAV5DYM7_ELECO|nr:hypothetical protein QOZ80_8BG0660700 [Eleusine coracana subsp. coracana]GJN16154.1 hypothetical protein PR202_gb03112 [Eleusine coracana subsp. coracana]
MPAPASSWDEQIFAAADMYSNQQQETLEAVLRQRVTAPQQHQDQAPAPADGGAARSGLQQRRRPQRTDRHSKIRTAQGVRDRRMRLSVGVARDFFALQDRLGFDKASKTVNWLLVQSKPAIDRLCDAPTVPGAPPPFGVPSMVVKGTKGEGSSSSTTGCFIKDTRRERSRGFVPDAQVALMEDRGGSSELDWNMLAEAAAAEPMEGLEYYNCYQMEEMMRCNNGGVLPR